MGHSVFISHRSTDFEIAVKLRTALQEVAGDATTFFLSEEIRPGANWLNRLHDRLRNSEFLLLVYTDPEADWGWCLYEAGYFIGSRSRDQHEDPPLFCVHHPGVAPPRQLQHLQTAHAVEQRLGPFLQHFIDKVNPAMARSVAKVQESIRLIVAAMQHRTQRNYVSPQLQLIVPEHAKSTSTTDADAAASLAGAHFVGPSETFQSVFDRVALTELSWAEMQSALLDLGDEADNKVRGAMNARWLKELADAVADVNAGRRPRQLQGLILNADKRCYRPVLRKVRSRAGGLECNLVFAQDVTTTYLDMPETTQKLATAIRMSLRFKFDICIGFIRRVRFQPPARMRELIRDPFADILIEAEARGISAESLVEAFDDADQATYTEIVSRWWPLEAELFAIVGFDRDRLLVDLPTEPLSKDEIARVASILKRLAAVIDDFLDLSIRRVQELVRAPVPDLYDAPPARAATGERESAAQPALND